MFFLIFHLFLLALLIEFYYFILKLIIGLENVNFSNLRSKRFEYLKLFNSLFSSLKFPKFLPNLLYSTEIMNPSNFQLLFQKSDLIRAMLNFPLFSQIRSFPLMQIMKYSEMIFWRFLSLISKFNFPTTQLFFVIPKTPRCLFPTN
jgi:hypothetical protein